MICSNGFKKSFWKRKFANSPFSKNFIVNCLNESTAKKATSSFELQPALRRKHEKYNSFEKIFKKNYFNEKTLLKCSPNTFQILVHCKRIRPIL